ncbi:hypothetical protein CR513_12423, partial [Mucuna pruriens]
MSPSHHLILPNIMVCKHSQLHHQQGIYTQVHLTRKEKSFDASQLKKHIPYSHTATLGRPKVTSDPHKIPIRSYKVGSIGPLFSNMQITICQRSGNIYKRQ